MSNRDRVLTFVHDHPGTDDDEICRALGINARQQVNQICRLLEARGLLIRERSSSGKIVNSPTSGARTPSGENATESPLIIRRTKPAVEVGQTIDVPIDADLRSTLLLIPCSAKKNAGGTSTIANQPIIDELPGDVGQRLSAARRGVLANADLDNRLQLPAWRRYAGTFYTAAGRALRAAIDADLRLLILSGGYGVVKATEPIGVYSMPLSLGAWPPELLKQVLLAYATRHNLSRMRAFVSQSTGYYRLVAQTPWRQAGVTDAIALTPESARGAMVKAPRAQGEAFAAFLDGTLTEDWKSSDGLGLRAHRLA